MHGVLLLCRPGSSHPTVLGSSTRTFNAVLQLANNLLGQTFGMEIVELQSMPSEKDISEKDADLLKNTGVKKKGAFRLSQLPGTKTILTLLTQQRPPEQRRTSCARHWTLR